MLKNTLLSLVFVGTLFVVTFLFVPTVSAYSVMQQHRGIPQTVCSGDTCDGQDTSGCTTHESMLDRKGIWDNNGVKFGQLSIWFSSDCLSYWAALQNITGHTIWFTCYEIIQTGADNDGGVGSCSGGAKFIQPGQYAISGMLGQAIPVSYWHGYSVTSPNGNNPYYTTNTATFHD